MAGTGFLATPWLALAATRLASGLRLASALSEIRVGTAAERGIGALFGAPHDTRAPGTPIRADSRSRTGRGRTPLDPPRIEQEGAMSQCAAGLLAVALLAACGAGAKSSPKIALLLPESKTARYESQDRPRFEARVRALCPECAVLYSNANQDAAAQQSQAEAALTNGARVLVIAAVDGASAAAIAERAKQQHAAVIAYDRLILHTDALDSYISFDNRRVGELQGQSLLEALGGKSGAAVVMIHGSPTDHNAALFKQGARGVLEGRVRIAMEYDTPDWSPDRAQDEMQQALTALHDAVDGVYAANDGTAGGAIAAMKAAGLQPLPPVTGQDAELAAIQRILLGEQYMTVYKAIRREAESAAELAVARIRGQPLPAAMINGKTFNGAVDVPSVLLAPVAVTRTNLASTVVADGFWSRDQICGAPYADACKAAGL
jgi:D-xylose transport system substrate-binding protein